MLRLFHLVGQAFCQRREVKKPSSTVQKRKAEGRLKGNERDSTRVGVFKCPNQQRRHRHLQRGECVDPTMSRMSSSGEDRSSGGFSASPAATWKTELNSLSLQCRARQVTCRSRAARHPCPADPSRVEVTKITRLPDAEHGLLDPSPNESRPAKPTYSVGP